MCWLLYTWNHTGMTIKDISIICTSKLSYFPSSQFITSWLWHVHFFFCFHAFLDYIWIAYAATWLIGVFFEAKDASRVSWMFLTKPSLADTPQVYRLLLKLSFFRCGNYFSRTEKDHLLINAVVLNTLEFRENKPG